MVVVIVLALVISVVFSPGVGTGYVFDDITSVLPLQQLSQHPEQFWAYVFSDVSGSLGRPVSVATFALEKILLKSSSDVSQYISISIHVLNAGLVFVLTRLLFCEVGLNKPAILAFLVAIIWAVSPQKVSAVLYIVQRMALLATTLTLLALIFYAYARVSAKQAHKVLLTICTTVCLMLAPFAKENGALAVPLIAALELFVFSRGLRGVRAGRLAAQGVLLFGFVLFLAWAFRVYLSEADYYATRAFDYEERLLFSAVSLVDYARQFFLPETSRMGLIHDDFDLALRSMQIGMSLVAVSLMVALLVSLVATGKGGVVGFSLAFYFIAHSLETSFLPLEVYFEHRNYLPSVGLAVLCVFFIAGGISRGFKLNVPFALPSLFLFSVVTAFSTFSYAHEWSSYRNLVSHHLQGHPRSSRANSDFALVVAGSGDLERAAVHIDRAIEYSRISKSSKPMGDADRVILKVAAACLSNRRLDQALLDISKLSLDNAILSGGVNLLTRMFRDSACTNGKWSLISDWLFRLVESTLQNGGALRWYVLKDLAAFERERGNFSRSYVYASMASEKRPVDGTLAVLKLEAAVRAGDHRAIFNELKTMKKLREDGYLRPVEVLYYERHASLLDSGG
ncbi:hypothetical protein [Pseudohaliea rubra]|uniref:hypothetical protein n=1 Tax=Pseudohaliea rubra TaxID=475795 RepID=UPI001184AA24|nr:hypothetical protein [Pseudohaliea rubra]